MNRLSILVASALLVTVEVALADMDGAAVARTGGVAEMLQRKQEHQLRDQLVRENRWDEVRELDAAQLRRQQVQIKQTLTRMNTELAREGTVDTPVNGDGVVTFCAPGGVPAKSSLTKFRPEPVSPGTDTSNVR